MKLSLGKYLLPTYVALTFAFLAIPIIYPFVFCLNDLIKANIIWASFLFASRRNMGDAKWL